MVVSLSKGSKRRVFRVANAVVTELENHRLLRSKDWEDRACAVAAVEKAIARLSQSGWEETGRTDEDGPARVIDALGKRMAAWESLSGTTNSVWCSGHLPATRDGLDESGRKLPPAYRDFLLSTDGFMIRCRFDRAGHRNEAAATFLKTSQIERSSDAYDVQSYYPDAVKKQDILVEVDVADPHVRVLDAFSGAVLHPKTGKISVWREGTREEEHPDFTAFFEDWLRRFDQKVTDTWGDVARR